MHNKVSFRALALLSICCLTNVALAEVRALKASLLIAMDKNYPHADMLA